MLILVLRISKKNCDIFFHASPYRKRTTLEEHNEGVRLWRARPSFLHDKEDVHRTDQVALQKVARDNAYEMTKLAYDILRHNIMLKLHATSFELITTTLIGCERASDMLGWTIWYNRLGG